jgi:hypothetical protein
MERQRLVPVRCRCTTRLASLKEACGTMLCVTEMCAQSIGRLNLICPILELDFDS